MFCHHFVCTKKNQFFDFLYASLVVEALPKMESSLTEKNLLHRSKFFPVSVDLILRKQAKLNMEELLPIKLNQVTFKL